MSLAKLKKYADAYNINIDHAVEKDNVIDGILAARVRVSPTSSALIGVLSLELPESKWLSLPRE
jgi:hypothetical protein